MLFQQEDQYANDTGIYRIRNINDGFVYIGQTSACFQKRFWHHKWKLTHHSHDNPHLQRAYDKYGPGAFVFEVIEVVRDKALLDAAEIKHIRQAPKKYNMLDGGGGRRGYPMKDTTKALIGQANRQHMLGSVQSQETRAKRSRSLTDNPKTRRKSNMSAIREQVIMAKQMFMSGACIRDVASQTGLSYHSANAILSNNTWNNHTIEGWDTFIANRNKKKHLTRQDAQVISQLSADGADVSELSIRYGVCRQTIQNILRNRTFK